ncbi:ribosomal L1 domain-containing protein CG13096 [Eupeodes corollae]|uniref:ribosomal L1 domain-containing protein CG13096 n=1 Tax=Eupeodes corollae TaxID=290404 RepID=UPI002492846E|nr:ribosomal L1 domain-containing protein CG13096 [Eupeodes corollae]
METKESATEKKVKLLWNQANILPQENHTIQLLRSFYLTTCKKLGSYDAKLPALTFVPSVMCPKCSSIWSESKFSLSLKPLRIHSQKAEKLVEKLKTDQKSLSRKQKKRAKWLKKKICNNVEITCEFCKLKTKQALIKTKEKIKTEEKEPEIEIPTKKKKKKKDKSAGLKLDKVIKPPVTLQPQSQPHPKKPNPNPPAKKNNKSKAQPAKAKIEKTISKTQKQNSLLQLAKMLKSQIPVVGTKPNNQLEKLLR